jgi:hypothetical protein
LRACNTSTSIVGRSLNVDVHAAPAAIIGMSRSVEAAARVAPRVAHDVRVRRNLAPHAAREVALHPTSVRLDRALNIVLVTSARAALT